MKPPTQPVCPLIERDLDTPKPALSRLNWRARHVGLSKLSAEYVGPGALPTHYTLKGHLLDDLIVGLAIHVSRYERAAQAPDEPATVRVQGLFESGPVMRLTIDETNPEVAIAATRNSHWRVELLPPVSATAAAPTLGVGAVMRATAPLCRLPESR